MRAKDFVNMALWLLLSLFTIGSCIDAGRTFDLEDLVKGSWDVPTIWVVDEDNGGEMTDEDVVSWRDACVYYYAFPIQQIHTPHLGTSS